MNRYLGDNEMPQWAPKVEREKIRKLYLGDAQGFVDEERIDEVGIAIYARCESIRIVTEIRRNGNAECLRCGHKFEFDYLQMETILCKKCGWSVTWVRFHKSYKGKQVWGGRAYPAFERFLRAYPNASTPQQKMLLIDSVVHACHESIDFHHGTAPAAKNLLKGSFKDIADFLEELAYSSESTPGLDTQRKEYRSKLEAYEKHKREKK